jgi:hypothetical protein
MESRTAWLPLLRQGKEAPAGNAQGIEAEIPQYRGLKRRSLTPVLDTGGRV